MIPLQDLVYSVGYASWWIYTNIYIYLHIFTYVHLCKHIFYWVPNGLLGQTNLLVVFGIEKEYPARMSEVRIKGYDQWLISPPIYCTPFISRWKIYITHLPTTSSNYHWSHLPTKLWLPLVPNHWNPNFPQRKHLRLHPVSTYRVGWLLELEWTTVLRSLRKRCGWTCGAQSGILAGFSGGLEDAGFFWRIPSCSLILKICPFLIGALFFFWDFFEILHLLQLQMNSIGSTGFCNALGSYADASL